MPHLTLFVDINRTITLMGKVQKKDNETSIAELVAEQCILSDGRSYKATVTALGGDDEERYTAYHKLLKELDSQPQAVELRALESILRIALNTQNGPVFRSFIVLIKKLREMKTPHTVVLRSFGTDTAEVIAAIETAVPGVKFTASGKFEDSKLLVDGCVVSPTCQLTKASYQSWQDDYSRWKNYNESWEGGKPFPAAREGDISIFLDDNAERKEIIALRPSIRDQLLKSGHLVAVDTIAAMVDPNYFWDLINSVNY